MRFSASWLIAVGLLVGCSPSNESSGSINAGTQPTAADRQAMIDDRQQRQQLADEVVSGSKSFSEAGCGYSGGEWDDDRTICRCHFFVRKADNTTQEDALAKRLDVMASMASDPTAATATGKEVADKFISDHPEDYRGAMGAAIRAARHDGYLAQADKDKLHQLTVEIPLIGTLPREDQPATTAQPPQQSHLKEVP